jgi:hypothetical protein
LRARIQGEFTAVEETTTDSQGRFFFEELRVDDEIQYIPGVNQGEVHYPGPRLRLTTESTTSNVKIVAYESLPEPNPLVIQRHDILVKPNLGSVEITESLVIENPSTFCYVGQTPTKADRVVTLRLSIPPDFEKVTFEKEFFGRHFMLIDGKLLTGIPWPPGIRQLKFTYVVPNENNYADWHRTVDLPCSDMRLTVLTDNPNEVSCDLEAVRSVDDDTVTFATADLTLPVGHEVQLQVGRVPVPMMVYGRWAALTVLVTLVCGMSVFLSRPKRAS